MSHLTRDGSTPRSVTDARAVIGVWCTASRQKMRMQEAMPLGVRHVGPWVQVSRLGHPLINEVIIPLGKKDYWNAVAPHDDAQFLTYVQHPELAGLLPVLYPKVFPHLAAYTAPRADLAAILMTGIPAGIVPGFQNFTGKRPADMLRLVNKHFFESTAAERFATLFFGIYDDRTRRMRYVNCGHCPPLLLRATGALERLGPTATPLGAFVQSIG